MGWMKRIRRWTVRLTKPIRGRARAARSDLESMRMCVESVERRATSRVHDRKHAA